MDNLEYYINQFTWWISSDEYLTPDGACFDMENVDINKSSMCITASNLSYRLLNSRPKGNVIAVSPTGDERVTEDWTLEDWDSNGTASSNGCLFAFPMLWPKLLSSGGSQIVWHTRHNELRTAIRGNAWSYPFWLLLNNKTFSVVNPDCLTDQPNQVSLSDMVLWTGWSLNTSAVPYISHSSGTETAYVEVGADYGTNPDYTTTNYQIFCIYVNGRTQWGFRVKVTADLDVFKWDDDGWKFELNSTDSDQHKTWDWIETTASRWERFCFAINGLNGSAKWEIQPSSDFDGKIYKVKVINQENFLSADGDNNPDHLLSLDNSTVKDLGRAGMSIDTTDLQNRAVITEWKGNYVVWAWNYAVIMNTNIVKDGYQVKPFLDIILATSYEIMGITTFGDQITFYANSNGSGYQIVWDGASLYANYIYTWAGQTFETIISSLGYDYVTVRSARNEMQYYVVNWPQRNQIWWSMEMLSSPNGVYKRIWKDKTRMLTQRDDKEIGWQLGIMWCWQPVFAWISWDLLVYGSRKAWIGNAWYKPLSVGFDGWESGTEWLKYAEIECLWPAKGWSIAIYYKNWNGQHCVKILYDWYWDDGEWKAHPDYRNRRFSYTLNPIIGSHFLEKEIDKFFISYKLPNEYWDINLYAKVDDDMFWRVKPVSTVQIAKGDIYYMSDENTTFEYIGTEDGRLIFRRIGQMKTVWDVYLYRSKWEWTSTIQIKEVDNWIKVGSLSYNGFDHNYQNLMNTQVGAKLPFFHKIQFKIEWKCNLEDTQLPTNTLPPEIYNIYIPFKQHTVW